MDINAIWQAIAPYVTVITSSGILSTVIVFVMKLMFTKAMNRIDVEKIADKATDKGVAKVEKITFKHEIQPLVESKLKEIQETANNVAKTELVKMEEKYDKLVTIMECFAQYFDNSVGVPESAKESLKKAIEIAKVEQEPVVESVIVKEEKKVVVEKKSDVSVDR